MKKRNTIFTFICYILVLIGLGLGYASLQTNLNITGTTILKDNRWDIHLENVQVKQGSVTASTPVINTNKDTVTYSATLEEPGDFYEFTVDAKNDGSIDGMISNISSKLNGVEITTLPTALSYSLTYDDGIEIDTNHLLEANDKVTYKIKVAYRTDITAQDLPSTETSLNFSFTITYVQADNSATSKPEYSYTISNNNIQIGSPIPNNITKYTNYNDAILAFGYPLFIRHLTDGNQNVETSSIGFIINNKVYYVTGAGATYNSNYDEYNNDSIYYDSNRTTLLNAFGSENCTIINSDGWISTNCTNSDYVAQVYMDGIVSIHDNSNTYYCYINDHGASHCFID